MYRKNSSTYFLRKIENPEQELMNHLEEKGFEIVRLEDKRLDVKG